MDSCVREDLDMFLIAAVSSSVVMTCAMYFQKEGAQGHEVTPGQESLHQWSQSLGSHFIVAGDLVI